MAQNQSLFSDDLISKTTKDVLQSQGFSIRSLRRNDYDLGHLEPLKDLTHVGDISRKDWIDRFDYMADHKGTYYTIVITSQNGPGDESIVATGTLIAEKKLYVRYMPSNLKTLQNCISPFSNSWKSTQFFSLYKLGSQGHIEDIAVTMAYQGKRLGLRLLEALNHVAKEVGCYKVILNCSAKNIGFYEKCGFETAGQEMSCYFDKEARARGV